ncbi:phosphatidylinositol 5-phosphate 4-kinase type-2 alpha isoform X2 [Lingula anatina]|uniref:1-phosphatidylinositol-5-phosphate 4-kinase n=1 Tax=Lingula anatina TaxID=7574 RepID=A0A1S3HUG5_LINAN|nr:phosphatidylinositol 5-phosphate 4-kinase type-2 alpha isoform X1 [Lingula anatina]XP_013388700.1 phosphatidylinositol 5-phosphate 4-kinase type-2 alpha isoform X2 [Lingula anatina]|eukprot:XP_013388699.1 phosphatidylinositol 5-phosphate 4-kinase type-2 alpha isoform X1 [Lingula anatina]
MASAAGPKSNKKKRLFIKQKRKLFRANEPLLSVFMWGVNHSINELGHVNIPVMLMPDDFKAFSKVKVANHLFNKENMPSHFKVKEYCPLVFRNLRERFGVDDIDYMNSLTRAQPEDQPSSARTGARFLKSHDDLYVIKTLVSEEVEQMHHILKMYHQFIVERHAKTLLPQYLGMYRVTVNDTETYLVVMRNIFSPRLTIHKKYDLKGSTVDRQASDKEKAKELPTFKDNDFVSDGIRIDIGEEAKENLMETLKADTEFLCSLNIMDYSLLVGIHDVERGEQERINQREEELEDGVEEMEGSDDSAGKPGYRKHIPSEDLAPTPPDSPTMHCMPFLPFEDIDPNIEHYAMKSSASSPHKEIYFMGMVDVLTHYGVKKRTAQAAKNLRYGAEAEISTVKPEQYARRFLEFIQKSMQ